MSGKKLAKLRYNLWIYFILFAIFLVVVVWILQILLFDSIYQNKRFDLLNEKGNALSKELNTGEQEITDDKINSWFRTATDLQEVGIFPYLAYYFNNNLVVESIYSGYVNANAGRDEGNKELGMPDNNSSNSSSVNFSSIAPIKPSPNTPESTYSAVVSNSITKLLASNSEYLTYRYDVDNSTSSYVYVTTVSNAMLNDGYLVLVSSQQSLNDTIKVIQLQLIIVTVCLIVVAFFISWYISNKLSKPIIEMSETAKNWAAGDETVVFKGDGYLELSELADTLNYAKEGISQTGLLQRDLLANVSHDLKTPLTMIKAYAEMIRDLSGDIKAKRDLHTQVIIDEADRLAMLVNDILDLSKLQNGINVLEIKQVNLSEICETVVYRFKEFAEHSGYKIETSIEPDLFSDCDEQKIEQVFYNLIGNSINYTGDDKTIFVKLAKRDDGIILFESIDSGKGISEEKITSIWEKYYRFSETHQRPIKGTGLGLSIVKTILEDHKLKFGVKSIKDVGSNFFVEFKVSEGE